MIQRALSWLFARVYAKWLWDDWDEKPMRVRKVLGWRTAICDDAHGMRRGITPCFWWFK